MDGAKGVLAVWHDIAPEGYDEFVRWHTREHMPERLAVPGFLRGCRYLASQADPMCFNFYETKSPATLTSEAYLQRLNDPTPWTTRTLKHFRNVNRTAGRALYSVGVGEGGAIATVRGRLADPAGPAGPVDRVDRADATLRDQLAPALAAAHEPSGIVAVHLWRGDAPASLVATKESEVRGPQTEIADVVVAIESNDETYASFAVNLLQQHPAFQAMLAPAPTVGIYHLQHRCGDSRE